MKIILKGGTGQIIEKKSRFIANVIAVNSEEEAVLYIEEIKKKYWDARHNCYAYVCGDIMRFSDDGEPAGTAGKPILEVIKGADLRNCLIVVTRYFGGVLLGTGGLLRAYQDSAKAGLESCEMIEKIYGYRYTFTMDYSMIGKIQYAASKQDFYIYDISYGALVTADVLVEVDKDKRFEKMLDELSSGAIQDVKKANVEFGISAGKAIVL